MSGRPKIANGRIGDVAPFRCGTAPGLCVSTCMLVVGGRHRGRTLCIWHPLGVGGLQPLRNAIGAAQSYYLCYVDQADVEGWVTADILDFGTCLFRI